MRTENTTLKVMLASTSPKTSEVLAPILRSSRLQQVGQAESAIQVRKQLYEKAPDIVIINTPLSDELGTQLAVELADRNLAVLLLVKNDLQDQISYQMEPHGILTLSKPVSGSALIQALSFLRPFRMKLLEM